jgi:hypothetical protein
MANFKTHVTVSSVLGVGYGAVAAGIYHVPITTSVLAAGLCGVAGMLPDLDSGPGRPLRESSTFAAAIVPIMLLGHFQQWGMTHEMIILAGATLYFLIRFGLPKFLELLTDHRGMFHSIPAAILVGEIAFVLASGSDVSLRVFKAGAVTLGFLSHLILDEIWSVEFFSKHPGLKKSFGTAFKFVGKGWWPNLLTFSLLAMMSCVSLNEPRWLQEYCQQLPQTPSQQASDNAKEPPTVIKNVSKWLNSWK